MTPLTLPQLRQTLWIIWAALLSALPLYAVVAVMVGPVSVGMADSTSLLAQALGVFALVASVIAHLSWRKGCNAALAVPLNPGDAETNLQAEQRHFITAWALNQSIGVYGLVLALLGSPLTVWPLFIGSATLLFLIHRPVSGHST